MNEKAYLKGFEAQLMGKPKEAPEPKDKRGMSKLQIEDWKTSWKAGYEMAERDANKLRVKTEPPKPKQPDFNFSYSDSKNY
jgi:hypothetical protein